MRGALRLLSIASVLSLATLSGGCGGGGGGGTPGGGTALGVVTLAMTDAPSDAIDLFEVDVVSVKLRRADGAVVEALPRTTRIDLADLVALSDLLTTATVPTGTYRRIELTLDPTTAAVHLDGQASLAALLDATGAAFTGPTTVGLDLPHDRPLVVAPGTPRFLELDVDLDASTTVDPVLNTVRLGTVLYADVDPSSPKPVRAYGRLVSTDATARTVTFELLRRRDLGRGTDHVAHTDASTRFEVDGRVADGATGFAALASKPAGTRLEIRGLFDPARRALLARVIEAGRGVFDGTRDFVEGLVVARSGGAGTDPTLTVRGMGVNRGAAVTFDRTFTVTASFANTKVVRFGDAAAHDTDDVNVGQRILAFGALTAGTLDATSSTDGLLRLVETEASGLATGAPASGVLTLSLRHVGRRPTVAFDFTVASTALVDPAAFQVGVGALSLAGIGGGSAVVARGFFVPMDADPSGTDFEATSVVDRTHTASLLGVHWDPPVGAPFTSAASTGVTLDLSGATVAKVDVGALALTDLLGGPAPQVVPAALGGFAIAQSGAITLFTDFGAWLTEVQARLSTANAGDLLGLGRYDPPTTTLTARRLLIRLR